jgi:hypothetical protein
LDDTASSFNIRSELHGVLGGGIVPGTDLVGVDANFPQVKILPPATPFGDIPVLVADLDIVGYHLVVEVHLYLSIRAINCKEEVGFSPKSFGVSSKSSM